MHAAICFCTPSRSPSYVLLCACVSVLFVHLLQLYTHAIVVCAVCCVQALLWLMSSCALGALQLRQFLGNKDQEDQTCLKLASCQFSLPCFAGRYSSNFFPQILESLSCHHALYLFRPSRCLRRLVHLRCGISNVSLITLNYTHSINQIVGKNLVLICVV